MTERGIYPENLSFERYVLIGYVDVRIMLVLSIKVNKSQ